MAIPIEIPERQIHHLNVLLKIKKALQGKNDVLEEVI